MLTEKLKSAIEKVDILTDFDQTMIREQSLYRQIFAYFLYLNNFDRLSFLRKLMKNYGKCRIKDVHFVYSMLADCPIEVLDKVVCKCTQNNYWDELIDKKNFKKIGVVSRNNHRIISKYLDLKNFENIEIPLIAANKPEIKGDVYTGDVELVVNNGNLVDFVREKEYIHGRDEKKILENFGDFRIHTTKIGRELYISTKQKKFMSNFPPKSLKVHPGYSKI